MLWVRVFFESLGAIVIGLARVITGRHRASHVVLKPGDLAPDFSLPGTDDRLHRLSDSRGRAVVLMWFPRAFTGGCTVQCLGLAHDRQAWRPFAADVFAVTVDTPGHARSFARAVGLDTPILSDVTGEVARQYGVAGPGGFPRRWTFYIGPDGRILDVDRSVSPASHAQDIGRRLQTLGIGRSA